MEVKTLTFEEFFVEVHSIRGNTSLFEALNPDTGEWTELDVWTYRNSGEEWWAIGFVLQVMEPKAVNLRVTLFPETYDTDENVTYHPSVPAWKVDIEQVVAYYIDNNPLLGEEID